MITNTRYRDFENPNPYPTDDFTTVVLKKKKRALFDSDFSALKQVLEGS